MLISQSKIPIVLRIWEAVLKEREGERRVAIHMVRRCFWNKWHTETWKGPMSSPTWSSTSTNLKFTNEHVRVWSTSRNIQLFLECLQVSVWTVNWFSGAEARGEGLNYLHDYLVQAPAWAPDGSGTRRGLKSRMASEIRFLCRCFSKEKFGEHCYNLRHIKTIVPDPPPSWLYILKYLS